MESVDLAKEWAVCRPNDTNGWVHKYKLDTDGLRILDFQKMGVFAWLAELMKHRDAADSRRDRMLAKKFISPTSVSGGMNCRILRIYRCECENVMDRDKNAAINIREEARRILTA